MPVEDLVQDLILFIDSIDIPLNDGFPRLPSEEPPSPLESPLELECQNFEVPGKQSDDDFVLRCPVVV